MLCGNIKYRNRSIQSIIIRKIISSTNSINDPICPNNETIEKYEESDSTNGEIN